MSQNHSQSQFRLFFRFGLVGVSGIGVNLGVLALLSSWGLVSTLSSALAIELSILSNFLLNDQWTFSQRRKGLLLHRALRFQFVSLIGAMMQWFTFVFMGLIFALSDFSFGGWAEYEPIWQKGGLESLITHPPELGSWQYLAQLFGIAIATSWNFLVNLTWTWGVSKHS